jgi:protein-tyrosine kinase
LQKPKMNKTVDKSTSVSEPARDRSRAIGAILVEQGRITGEDVSAIQRYAVEKNMRFGDAAQELGLLSQADIDLAIAQQYNYPVLGRGGQQGVADDVVAAYQPQSEIVEPLRALRSRLVLRGAGKAEQRVLAVTSPDRGDGRSWLAANLATVFAQMGERTLLIDADMRHPRQHVLFNLNNAVGLSALLTGRAGREIATRIHPHLRLFVLPAGIMPPNPQELLGRQVFELILGIFAEQFAIVIIDTPAASETADSQIVASLAGNAVVVARRNHTREENLKAATQDLLQSGVNVVGGVLNDC